MMTMKKKSDDVDDDDDGADDDDADVSELGPMLTDPSSGGNRRVVI